MKQLLQTIASALLLIVFLVGLYVPFGRTELPQIGTFFSGDSGIWQNARSANPPLITQLRADNISSYVQIHRDERGVPHIFSEEYNDALYGLGFAMAQDRLFQMFLYARAVAGELTEWLGDEYIETDKAFLRMGLDRASWDDYEALSESERDMIKAFSNGVNMYIHNVVQRERPIEFKYMALKERYWRPVDAMRVWKLYDFMASFNLDGLHQQRVLNKVGPDVFRAHYLPKLKSQLTPTGQLWDLSHFTLSSSTNLNAFESLTAKVQADVRAIQKVITISGNPISATSVAVNQSKTKGFDAAMLITQHADRTIPSLFYEAQLSGNGVNAYGLTIPGIPGLISGYNKDLAWSMSPSGLNTVQWIQAGSENLALAGSTKKHSTKIKRKGPFSINFTYQLIGGKPMYSEKNEYLLLNWPTYEKGLNPSVLKQMANASTVEEFKSATMLWTSPHMNAMVVDKHAHVATWQAKRETAAHIGLMDVTSFSSTKSGNSPKLVSIQNPTSHSLVVTKGVAFPETQPLMIRTAQSNFNVASKRWHALLKQKQEHNRDELISYQADVHLDIKGLIEQIRQAHAGTLRTKINELTSALTVWDLMADIDSAPPVFLNSFFSLLRKYTWDEIDDVYLPTDEHLVELLLNQPNHPIFDMVNTPEKENGRDILLRAFSEAYEMTILEHGGPSNWSWGNINRTRLRNIAHQSFFSQLDRGYYAERGMAGTISPFISGTVDFGDVHRMYIEVKNGEITGYSKLLGGISGNSFSRFYMNNFDVWSSSRFDEILRADRARQSAAYASSTIEIVPVR